VLSDNPRRKKSSTSYRAVCAYLVLAWHSFPIVWTANVLGKATRTQIEIGYIICDVLAKFLPPSLYLTVATSRTR
jgi:bacteriorhodopsin